MCSLVGLALWVWLWLRWGTQPEYLATPPGDRRLDQPPEDHDADADCPDELPLTFSPLESGAVDVPLFGLGAFLPTSRMRHSLNQFSLKNSTICCSIEGSEWSSTTSLFTIFSVTPAIWSGSNPVANLVLSSLSTWRFMSLNISSAGNSIPIGVSCGSYSQVFSRSSHQSSTYGVGRDFVHILRKPEKRRAVHARAMSCGPEATNAMAKGLYLRRGISGPHGLSYSTINLTQPLIDQLSQAWSPANHADSQSSTEYAENAANPLRTESVGYKLSREPGGNRGFCNTVRLQRAYLVRISIAVRACACICIAAYGDAPSKRLVELCCARPPPSGNRA